jgi:predicted small metal-binding protein
MKTMTCKQLGGACDLAFSAESFEKIGKLSKQHAMAMHEVQDVAHLKAMNAMSELMKSPENMQAWFESKEEEFNALAES